MKKNLAIITLEIWLYLYFLLNNIFGLIIDGSMLDVVFVFLVHRNLNILKN